MEATYAIADSREILSPALLIFEEVLERNLRKMIEIAGVPGRLRPHCKTHKMREVIELELKLGITKHKAATLAEAEMLAQAGVRDVFLAYNLVGPNIARAVRFLETYPQVNLAVTVDHPGPMAALDAAMRSAGLRIDVLLDIDSGQHRTGLPLGAAAMDLYQQMAACPGLKAVGLHLYDGQNHQKDLGERTEAVMKIWHQAAAFRDALVASGYAVDKIVCGGTGSFPVFAAIDDPAIELSPGTCVFHDAGYGEIFPDLDFKPAQLIFSRVVSRPGEDLITLDLGYKACAADRPAGRRLLFPDLPNAQEVLQNEEHLVLKTSRANEYQPGDSLLAIARHACPTSAMYQQAYVIREGKVQECWKVVARDRCLTI
ncbi:MAG: D-TA family PLP-dependent enzyme [Pirellulaceae bacterium]|nr:D-TA family PLP-dependent enzyme [Pirellulaceae bacterium]